MYVEEKKVSRLGSLFTEERKHDCLQLFEESEVVGSQSRKKTKPGIIGSVAVLNREEGE
jgi:hypothetical protein